MLYFACQPACKNAQYDVLETLCVLCKKHSAKATRVLVSLFLFLCQVHLLLYLILLYPPLSSHRGHHEKHSAKAAPVAQLQHLYRIDNTILNRLGNETKDFKPWKGLSMMNPNFLSYKVSKPSSHWYLISSLDVFWLLLWTPNKNHIYEHTTSISHKQLTWKHPALLPIQLLSLSLD